MMYRLDSRHIEIRIGGKVVPREVLDWAKLQGIEAHYDVDMRVTYVYAKNMDQVMYVKLAWGEQ